MPAKLQQAQGYDFPSDRSAGFGGADFPRWKLQRAGHLVCPQFLKRRAIKDVYHSFPIFSDSVLSIQLFFYPP
jgi:hypothetical protein